MKNERKLRQMCLWFIERQKHGIKAEEIKRFVRDLKEIFEKK